MDQSPGLKLNKKSKPGLPFNPLCLALIPAYNESEHIRDLVRLVQAYLPVLVVDDGSIDDTISLAKAAGAEVLRQTPNQGKGATLRAGFHWALEHGYAVVLTLDGDGQHAPEEIPKFLEAYAAGPVDLIIGMRSFRKMPWIRRMANSIGQHLFSWALGQDIPDNQSGYRMVSGRLMEALLDSTEQGYEFEVEMIATCLKRRYSLKWVPIRTIYEGETSHIHPLKHVVNYLRIVWKTRQRIRKDSLG